MTRNSKKDSPWVALDELGTGLTVNHFLTTLLSEVTNALRRDVTTVYAEKHGLSVSEWRVLSLVAHAGDISFGDLVTQSTSDKALVSRTIRLLESRSLIEILPESPDAGKRLRCHITAAGKALHSKVIPHARRAQAQVLRILTPDDRDHFFRSLQILRHHFLAVASSDNVAPPKRQVTAKARPSKV
jgi:DNA-binding MarR family transcriptional regulator